MSNQSPSESPSTNEKRLDYEVEKYIGAEWNKKRLVALYEDIARLLDDADVPAGDAGGIYTPAYRVQWMHDNLVLANNSLRDLVNQWAVDHAKQTDEATIGELNGHILEIANLLAARGWLVLPDNSVMVNWPQIIEAFTALLDYAEQWRGVQAIVGKGEFGETNGVAWGTA